MRFLKQVKGWCRVDLGDDGLEHWFWTGAQAGGYTSITAPDYTRDPSGKTLRSQRGRRAVWHLKTRQPIPAGHMVYNTCQHRTCVNPACLASGPRSTYGQMIQSASTWQGNPQRRVAGRRNAAVQRKITPAMVLDILQSDEVARVLAERYHVHRSTIIRYRAGGQSDLGGFFSGLVR